MASRSRTKKPHFVPAAYLQFWDSTNKPRGRASQIWWTNGEVTSHQSVSRVAVQSDLYSVSNPNAAEDFFGEFEGVWSNLIKQVMTGKAPRADILAAMLLLHCGFLLLRNPIFDNQSEKERVDVVKDGYETFFRGALLENSNPETKEEAWAQITKNWGCHLLQAQSEPWITSDNPVLLLEHAGQVPALIFLPITPDLAVLGLRRGFLELSSQRITAEDTRRLICTRP